MPKLLVAACVLAACAHAADSWLPSPTLPDGLGVNIHFTDPKPGEMKMLAGAGFTWIRMDFHWAATEREKGKYDFSAYDRLLKALDEYKIRALLILDYGNPLYNHGLPPVTDDARQAFVNWAVAAVKHFQGRRALWEMWNEPNIKEFWKPKPNVDEYAKLALAVGKALREAAPDETFIGPAMSTFDWEFIEGCFQAGLLEYWSAVSVHPYRQSEPETVADDYRRLRLLIRKYAPTVPLAPERGEGLGVRGPKQIPIICSEWGYSASLKEHRDRDAQAKLLARELLTNIANEIPVQIWYDWHDDGPDETDAEDHFGTVMYAYHEGREPCYDPKPAYLAVKTLTEQLRGLSFNKQLVLWWNDTYT